MNERVFSPRLAVRRSVLQMFVLVFAIHLATFGVAVADEGQPAAAPPSPPAPNAEQKEVTTPAVSLPPETTPPPTIEQPSTPPVKLTPVAQPEEKKVAAAGPNIEKLTPVVVTGSLLPTAEVVGPAPVNTITAAEIEKSGAQDVLALVKKLDPTFVGNFNVGRTLDNGGFGEANVAIHNLPTLVLLNGHRLGNSAFSNGALVDLNTIPLGAIDRVEVLKDGSSALYGSDAIGGVVNIITKKNFTEVDMDGYFGAATGKGNYEESRASVVSGFVTDRSEFTAAAQYFHSNPLFTTDRSIASLSIDALNKRGVDGTSVSYMSPSFPGKVQDADGTSWYLTGYATPPVLPGHPSFTSVSDYNAAVVGAGQAAPYTQTPTSLTPDGFLNTTSFKTISIQQQDRRNFFGEGTYDLIGKQAQLFGEFLYANQESLGSLAPSPVIGLASKQSNIDIPADNPFNPFGIALGPSAGTNGLPPIAPRIRSRFIDSGNRLFDTQTDYYHIVAGLKGEFDPGYTYNAGYTYNRYDQIQFTKNAINGAALDLALQPNSDPTLAAQGLSNLTSPRTGTFVPVYDIFSYAGQNDPATLDAIRTTLFESGVSEEWAADGVVTGSPLELPAGKLGIAVGGGVRSASLSIDFDGLTEIGKVPGLNAQFPTSGTRDSYDFFAEIRVPLTSPENHIFGFHSLEVTGAGRFESFSPGGDDAVPKVALRWQPVDEQITIRANYAQSFVAPTTFDLFGGALQSNPNIADGLGAVNQETVAFVSNPGLKAVKGENYGAGVVFQPKAIKHLTVSVDYYHIQTRNDIFRVDQQAVTDDLNANGSASKYASLYTFANGSKLTTTAPNQVIDATWGSLDLPLENGAKTETDGLDMSATYVLPTESAGKFTFFAAADVVFKFLFSDPVIGGPFHYEGEYTDPQVAPGAQGLIPDYTISTGLAWDIQNWTYTISSRYIPEVKDKGFGFPANNETFTTLPTTKAPDGPTWTVASWFDIDMQLSYEFGRGRPLKDWYDGTRITVGINNITDEAPPLISSSSEDNTDKGSYDIIGRFVYFEVSKKF